MPTYLLIKDDRVINRSASVRHDAAWNWARNWCSKKPGRSPAQLVMHLAMLTRNDDGTVTVDADRA